MFRSIVFGAASAALFAGGAVAAPAQPPSQIWVITPTEDSCRTDIDLLGRSGQAAQISLISDGQFVELRFTKDDLPQRAFLPLRIDQKPFANLMLRMENPKRGSMVLSEETLAALRKGKTLQIAWLAEEPVSAPLGGSEQGIADLATCGAQVAAQHKAEVAAREEAKAREEAEARSKAVTEEQLAAAKAAREAAEATKRRETAEADRIRQQQAQADAERQRAAAQAERAREESYGYRDPYARRAPGYGYYPPPDED
ncbi:MAG TPA: hypothetical protein VLI41_09555 [Phenylobacterium sp.]|uniref:hypothetical protein n=1 Tax=Phenylobacterium sp. TaxID=1871053 RepID=UPI002CE1DF74|nr:hypothetical protein [Phenylobacterium sp.]HSV03439.1 hypothetical protein [Phenylobacterium sp.]